jgi:flagellar motor component MotA
MNAVMMLRSAMKKKPETALEQFNSFFPARVLMGIIGGLLGVIAMRLMGS